MCKFSIKVSVQKNYAKFIHKKLCNLLPLFKAFQRAIKSQNTMTGCRSKYRFCRVKVK